MSPDVRGFLDLLGPYQRRREMQSSSRAVLLGAAVSGVLLALLPLLGFSSGGTRAAGVAALVAVVLAVKVRSRRRLTIAHTAAAVERADATGDNTIVTAEEIASGRAKPPHRVVERALFAAAGRRLAATPANVFLPLGRQVGLTIAALLAVLVLGMNLPTTGSVSGHAAVLAHSEDAQPLAAGEVRIVITPPSYTRQPPSGLVNPGSITALEGSRIRLESLHAAGAASLVDPGGRVTPFERAGDVAALEIVAQASQPLLIRFAGDAIADRLIALRVQPDRRPTVRIERPARDLAFPEATGQVPVDIDASDDMGLESLTLRYTRISGSGETFTFEEGEWPLQVTRDAAARWTGRASLPLDRLALADGDTLVYRAVARDGKPGADPATSETFLIEIGRLSGIAATGFALPEDRDRQAISQQMLIIKTERLHGERATLTPDALLEQSRLLAVEQRMVKAEFVFMTGGEVADEVEEAEHSHELAEGRLENSAQLELLAAIREMSRAEARLNAGDTAQALEFERAALKALQRAFDRRRYLLRTLPERTRIDASRRLTGALDAARSSDARDTPVESDPLVRGGREILSALGAGVADAGEAARLASRMLALDPSADVLQAAALQLSGSRDGRERAEAVQQARRALIEVLRRRLSTAGRSDLSRDPLAGLLADELRRPSEQR